MKLPPLFDPDTRVLSPATLQHFAGLGIGLFVFLDLFYPSAQAFAIAVLVGFAWELAQWDTCRGLPICHEGEQLSAPFKPGFGWGPLDFAADVLGAGLAWWLL